MPNPKRKHTRSRRDSRRASNWRLNISSLSTCPVRAFSSAGPSIFFTHIIHKPRERTEVEGRKSSLGERQWIVGVLSREDSGVAGSQQQRSKGPSD